MIGEPTIRHARPEDQPALLEIVWQTVRVDPVGNARIIANPHVVEVPAEQLTAETACVAEIDGKPVGFAVVLPRPDAAAELDGLFVLPALQRAGIGRALIAAARNLALARGASTLLVIANPGATAFYRSMGFVEAGTARTEFGFAPAMQLRL